MFPTRGRRQTAAEGLWWQTELQTRRTYAGSRSIPIETMCQIRPRAVKDHQDEKEKSLM